MVRIGGDRGREVGEGDFAEVREGGVGSGEIRGMI